MDESKPTTPIVRNARGHFQKGQSGNPSGRVARLLPDGKGGMVSRTQLFQQHICEVVDTLMYVVRNGKDRDKIVAGKIIIEHGIGSPKQHVDLNTTDKSAGIVIKEVDGMDLVELRRLVNAKVIEVDAEIIEDEDDAE